VNARRGETERGLQWALPKWACLVPMQNRHGLTSPFFVASVLHLTVDLLPSYCLPHDWYHRAEGKMIPTGQGMTRQNLIFVAVILAIQLSETTGARQGACPRGLSLKNGLRLRGGGGGGAGVGEECGCGWDGTGAHKGITMDGPASNIVKAISDKVGCNLHNEVDHPLEIIKSWIGKHFDSQHVDANGNKIFNQVDDLSPIVSTSQCFDDLLTPADHVSR
jgi:hypothetical protein